MLVATSTCPQVEPVRTLHDASDLVGVTLAAAVLRVQGNTAGGMSCALLGGIGLARVGGERSKLLVRGVMGVIDDCFMMWLAKQRVRHGL